MLYLKNAPLLLRWHSKGFIRWMVLCIFITGTSYIHGQNTGMVFGPVITAGETLVDFRIAYNADQDFWVYRNHLQHSFSDSFNLRGITFHTIDSSNKWNFRLFRVEGLWQFLKRKKAGWDSALRLELQIAKGDDLPNWVRLAWSGMYEINDDWRITGNFLTGREIGTAGDSEALFEIRAQISRKISKTSRLAIDYFGNMNHFEALDDWESHRHQLGPTWGIRLNKTIITTGALFGLSEAAANVEYRLAIAYSF